MDNKKHFKTLGQTPWGNANGKKYTFAEMDHGYASNVYWYLVLRPAMYDVKEHDLYMAIELAAYVTDKFGSIADYKPWSDTETAWLRKGTDMVDAETGDIVYRERTIGNVNWREREALQA